MIEWKYNLKGIKNLYIIKLQLRYLRFQRFLKKNMSFWNSLLKNCDLSLKFDQNIILKQKHKTWHALGFAIQPNNCDKTQFIVLSLNLT